MSEVQDESEGEGEINEGNLVGFCASFSQVASDCERIKSV